MFFGNFSGTPVLSLQVTSDPSPLKLRPALLFQMHRRAFYETGLGGRDENHSVQALHPKREAARLAGAANFAALLSLRDRATRFYGFQGVTNGCSEHEAPSTSCFVLV
jgi:hypothetical protein